MFLLPRQTDKVIFFLQFVLKGRFVAEKNCLLGLLQLPFLNSWSKIITGFV